MRKYSEKDIVYIAGEEYQIIKIFMDEENLPIYKIKGLNSNNELFILEENIFPTKEESLLAEKQNSFCLVQEYKDKIKNLSDLLRFPLDYCLFGEHTNEEAKKAYEEKAEELTGIFLK